MIEIPETHMQGFVSVDADAVDGIDLHDCDLGLQVAWDGRIWLCINGKAWIRFKPNKPNTYALDARLPARRPHVWTMDVDEEGNVTGPGFWMAYPDTAGPAEDPRPTG